jgi:glucose-1-phosphate adenylyltransferase
VVLSSVKIGVGCNIKTAILDEGCEIPDGMQIGIDATADAARFHVTDHGVVLVTPDMLARLTARRA